MCKICDEYWSSKETTMKNTAVTKTPVVMELTPEEAIIIENIRALQEENAMLAAPHKPETQIGNEMPKWYGNKWLWMQKFLDMDDYEFIDLYADAVGDDVILSVLQDTVSPQQKWEAIFDCIDEDVLHELFEAYVSVDYKREMFLETQDREMLAMQLVDLIIDGDWTPEN